VGLERFAAEILGAGGARGGSGGSGGNGRDGAELERLLALWEDLLTLVVDPESDRLRHPEEARRLLPPLLEAAGIAPAAFWRQSRGQRSRRFLSAFSRNSRDIPALEISAFDLDKVAKERFRREPLTLGAAWHYGLWRAYFSHAAITHPANDGLREEFSTAWEILRKEPAVLWRVPGGRHLEEPRRLRLEVPILVGPLPHSDGHTLERAYLRAIEASDPEQDLKTESLVVVRAAEARTHAAQLAPHAPHLLVRFAPADLERLLAGGEEAAAWSDLLERGRIVELVWHEGLPASAARVLERWPHLLLSVSLRYFGGFWKALAESVATPGAALVQIHAGELKSYRLIPRVDAFLKGRLVRARVQLVSAGGDTDTVCSAAAVYEAVLLGANGGAITDLASIALVPELIDVYHGADPAPITRGLAERDPEALTEQAINTLACWQHSILDFLSCMGIDDVQKTSGNAMAITLTEDWVREVDALATAEFAERNRELNEQRIAAEPVPREVAGRFRVSRLLKEVRRLPELALAGRLQAHGTASWHLSNLNRNLTGDHLEVAYRMAAGEPPRVEDFFLAGDMGPWSLDGVRLKLSRASVAWSLARLAEDPAALDYLQLAVPRGFDRPGAAPVGALCELRLGSRPETEPLARWRANAIGGFEVRLPDTDDLRRALASGEPLEMVAADEAGSGARLTVLGRTGAGSGGELLARASLDGRVTLKRHPAGGYVLSGLGVRRPIWQGPVAHASISLGAASEDFLVARLEGNVGLTMVSSGEGGPIRLASDEAMGWESLQAASGHFGLHAADLRRVRDVEIKINQGAKPGKGGRLSGAKVTSQVSRARNIPVGTDALSPDPKHDIYSIEDMPAEVWLWLLFHNYCGIKISGSNYTKYVAAGMWSNFVVDYLLVDAGLAGSGNYHADSSHVGWPDILRTILHTHHALVAEKVDLDGSGPRPIRDGNGTAFGAGGGTRLFASGGLRDEVDVVKVLCAGADAVVVASLDKAVGFGCNQCGNCHLDCPRGGITTKPELTMQNDREVMRTRFRNWAALDVVKLAVLLDALNRESGAIDDLGTVREPKRLLRDIRQLRGRVDLLEFPRHEAREADDPGSREAAAGPPAGERELDSCRVSSLAVTEPVTVDAVWEAARISVHGGNNRGGGLDFAGFAPASLARRTCVFLNTIGPDRRDTIRRMLEHFGGCRFFDASGLPLARAELSARLDDCRVPVREKYAGEDGWQLAGLRENVGDFHFFFVDLDHEVLGAYARRLVASPRWLQRRTLFGDRSDRDLGQAAARAEAGEPPAAAWEEEFRRAAREEYFSVLAHLLDTRYYRTHAPPGAPPGKYAARRRGHVVSIGEDLGAVKISGWTHLIPEYFDFARFWERYPGAREDGGVRVTTGGRDLRTTSLYAHVWGMHHRYPTNSPAIDEEGRGNPAGAHPFKAYNLLLMHNGEQVGVDSTAPFLAEYGYVHADASMGPGAGVYEGDSVYERKALTDTEYAAYLVDFTRRVLGLSTEEATQIISPITGLDLASLDAERRKLYEILSANYVQLTPTGPYKFTIVESRPGAGGRPRVGFRENMDIKFLRPHEIVVQADTRPGGVSVASNGSEARIADAQLRVLRQQGVLLDAGTDLRFNMRPGGRPGTEEYGGVFEAFLDPVLRRLELKNRFGEEVSVPRAGAKEPDARPVSELVAGGAAPGSWRRLVEDRLEEAVSAARHDAERSLEQKARLYGPEDVLPAAAMALVQDTLERLPALSYDDYRYLVEATLPALAREGDVERALALRLLTELRKRLHFADPSGKSLSALEYATDGGRLADGSPEGGVYRLLDAVPALAQGYGRSRYLRLGFATRHDLVEPADPLTDVLVVSFRGFRSESFDLTSASGFLSEAVRSGWHHVVGYDFTNGPRYVGANLAWAGGQPARGVTIELYGREFGDFLGALLEGARLFVYGQAQSHAGMKADSGRLFVLQDTLNTCAYAAHGFTVSVWDSGSRFAVAGQNKVTLEDGLTPAPGFRSVHFGSPNEYAFEYLMSGGENSCHVVLGLAKPDRRGELSLRSRPYGGKFLLSGAAAGRLFIFDPLRRLDARQYRGNTPVPIGRAEWERDVVPLVNGEAWLRGAPVRADANSFSVRLEGAWRSWSYEEAFLKLAPVKAAKAQARDEAPPGLVKMVGQ
jgi:glutamate synthase domain-containing protein 2/glutamate synthase domain-containing protein 3